FSHSAETYSLPAEREAANSCHRIQPRRCQRGSLLVVALIFSAILAIALVSYIRLTVTTLRMSHRSLAVGIGTNLAESGAELAMAAINSHAWGAPWSIDGANATATYSGFSYPHGATGLVKVLVQNYASASPIIVAQAIVTPPFGPPISRMIEVSGVA